MERLNAFFKVGLAKDIIQGLATYDMRKEYIYEKRYVSNRKIYGKIFESSGLLSSDDSEKYITYKALTEKPCNFDADNSRGTCKLMGEIYNKLWGALNQYSNFVTISAFPSLDGKSLLFGGDVYNSLQTTINTIPECNSKQKCLQEYIANPKKFKELIQEHGMNDVLKVSHILGNFGLVPAYFNGYRGKDSKIQDYLDKSLSVLLDKGFNYIEILIEKNKSVFKRNNPITFAEQQKKTYRAFLPSDFVKYINTMFLWEMCSVENKINNISSDIEKWKKVVPLIVQRRSLFMAMMLYLSVKHKEAHNKIMNLIIESDDILTYKMVFEIIEKSNCLTQDIRCVIETTKNEILNKKINIFSELHTENRGNS